jgi:hypothetical protein
MMPVTTPTILKPVISSVWARAIDSVKPTAANRELE